jgi:hypothetical protein
MQLIDIGYGNVLNALLCQRIPHLLNGLSPPRKKKIF